MYTSQSTQPFRFLDLPSEIRNNIYDLLLCSWDTELEQEQDSSLGSLVSNLGRRCLSNPATALLRTNKQIQSEASDYMIKRNQFVRITCRALDVRKLFLGRQILVITTNARKTGQFQGYVMHMTLSQPAFSPAAFQIPDFEIMMLRADLPQLCAELDIESVMADANSSASSHESIRAEIKLNYAYGRFFTPTIQERLLSPIASLVRGVPNLRISGPVDPAIAQSVADQVAQPRWTDPEATLEEVGTGVDVGKRQWQQSNFYTAAESWAYALRTLERMRHSSSWLGLKHAGGEDFVNKTADLYFTLHLFHAQFLQIDMTSPTLGDHLVRSNGVLAIQHLRLCELASARFAQHTGSTWTPSNLQSAKMLYRHARSIRLMRDSAHRTKAVTLVEEAAALAPMELAIREEKDAVLTWDAEIEEALRLVEEEARLGDEAESQRSSFFGSLWTAVVELAA